MTADLVQFLRARLDEDEQTARAADLAGAGPNDEPLDLTADTPRMAALAEHIVRHDPYRVLAEVDAKRQAVNACEYFLNDNEDGPDPCAAAVLRALALPYADHPDYREERKP